MSNTHKKRRKHKVFITVYADGRTDCFGATKNLARKKKTLLSIVDTKELSSTIRAFRDRCPHKSETCRCLNMKYIIIHHAKQENLNDKNSEKNQYITPLIKGLYASSSSSSSSSVAITFYGNCVIEVAYEDLDFLESKLTELSVTESEQRWVGFFSEAISLYQDEYRQYYWNAQTEWYQWNINDAEPDGSEEDSGEEEQKEESTESPKRKQQGGENAKADPPKKKQKVDEPLVCCSCGKGFIKNVQIKCVNCNESKRYCLNCVEIYDPSQLSLYYCPPHFPEQRYEKMIKNHRNFKNN